MASDVAMAPTKTTAKAHRMGLSISMPIGGVKAPQVALSLLLRPARDECW
jgi:hypothetical protein